jgi:hypothetical protein
MTLKPSNFLNRPFNSVMNNTEHEIIARNVMVILSRTGDEWRSLSWEEYEAERTKDGAKLINTMERPYFDRVVGFCVAPESAEAFAPGWGK